MLRYQTLDKLSQQRVQLHGQLTDLFAPEQFDSAERFCGLSCSTIIIHSLNTYTNEHTKEKKKQFQCL